MRVDTGSTYGLAITTAALLLGQGMAQTLASWQRLQVSSFTAVTNSLGQGTYDEGSMPSKSFGATGYVFTPNDTSYVYTLLATGSASLDISNYDAIELEMAAPPGASFDVRLTGVDGRVFSQPSGRHVTFPVGSVTTRVFTIPLLYFTEQGMRLDGTAGVTTLSLNRFSIGAPYTLRSLAFVTTGTSFHSFATKTPNDAGGDTSDDGTCTSFAVATPGTLAVKPGTNGCYWYSGATRNGVCYDVSNRTRLQIEFTAPQQWATFQVTMHEATDACTGTRNTTVTPTAVFVHTMTAVSGSRQTVSIPLDAFRPLQRTRVHSLVFNAFNATAGTYQFHAIRFVGSPVASRCASTAAATSATNTAVFHRFTNTTGWTEDHQGCATSANWRLLGNATLQFVSDPYTPARAKLLYQLRRATGPGTHEWRIYTPLYRPGDITTATAFARLDDLHEFDFEIGYGTAVARTSAAAGSQDLVAYLTSQAQDGVSWATLDSSIVPISGNAWHTLTLDFTLDATGTQYVVRWLIDGLLRKTSIQRWGPQDAPAGLAAQVSLENLPWMGEWGNPPVYPGVVGSRPTNYCLFETYRYTPRTTCP